MGMSVVQSGGTLRIYGDQVKTHSKIPTGTYDVCFDKMSGFYLQSRNDLEVNEEKIYGSTPAKVDKVLKAFNNVERNFGIILSGKKGIGKSLFARQLAVKAYENNIPLLVASRYYPGIADFISSIEQEVIVLFDEFEKTFEETNDFDPQVEMLPLFDGLDSGKKLFVVTCNNVSKLNPCLLNRPGRFHYHFIIGNPTPDEISEYMTDKLDSEHHDVIPKLIGLSLYADLTYDVLRAIAFELNMGYSLSETLMDLNINKETCVNYDVRIDFVDGNHIVAYDIRIDLDQDKLVNVWFNTKNNVEMRIDFDTSDVKLSADSTNITVDPSKVTKYVDENYFDLDNPEDARRYEYYDKLEISSIKITRSATSTLNKFKF